MEIAIFDQKKAGLCRSIRIIYLLYGSIETRETRAQGEATVECFITKRGYALINEDLDPYLNDLRITIPLDSPDIKIISKEERDEIVKLTQKNNRADKAAARAYEKADALKKELLDKLKTQ